jgi:hypothetical protein
MTGIVLKNKTALAGALSLAVMALTANAWAAEDWQMERTSAGHPVLQGYYTNSSIVPFERPEALGTKEFYTQEELDERLARAAEPEDTVRGTAADVHYQFDDYGMARGQNATAMNLRTSIITSTPDGRLPPMIEEAEKRRQEIAAYRAEHNFDSAPDMSLSERCILWSSEGPPMVPLGYNSNLQIMQTDTHVVILMEMIHDARIIPLLDAPPPSVNIPQWFGNSWGRWEGDTLVIETTGYSGKAPISASRNVPLSPNARVQERISRIDRDTLKYAFTVSDPTIWEASFSGEYPMDRIDGPMFEYACQEGNYGLPNNLSGARAMEARAAAGE